MEEPLLVLNSLCHHDLMVFLCSISVVCCLVFVSGTLEDFSQERLEHFALLSSGALLLTYSVAVSLTLKQELILILLDVL